MYNLPDDRGVSQKSTSREKAPSAGAVKGSQYATPVAPDAHGNPAGPLGGGTEGQGAGTFPPGHCPESGHWRSTHQETQRQGASQGRGSGRTA